MTIPAVLLKSYEHPEQLTSADLDVLGREYGEPMRLIAAARRDAATSAPLATTTPDTRKQAFAKTLVDNVDRAIGLALAPVRADIKALKDQAATRDELRTLSDRMLQLEADAAARVRS